MKKKGVTLVEVVFSMFLIFLICFFAFSFISNSNKEGNDLNILSDDYIFTTGLLDEAVRIDEDAGDGVVTGTTDFRFRNINVTRVNATVDGVQINYELFTHAIENNKETSEDFTYNFDTIEYEEGNLKGGGLGSEILFDGQSVRYTPTFEIFPSDSYYIKNEPFGNPFATPQELGIYYRMDTDNVPDLDETHKNYLLEKGNSITIENYPYIGNDSLKYIQYFSEHDVEGILTKLAQQDPTNPWQVVYFKAPAVTFNNNSFSIASVIMDEKAVSSDNQVNSVSEKEAIQEVTQQTRVYEFDLKNEKFFPNNEKTHLIFIADGQFEWSTYNTRLDNTSKTSDNYHFKVNGGHVYFISMSGKHTSNLPRYNFVDVSIYNLFNTTADITNTFTVTPDSDGQVTVANTQMAVGDYSRTLTNDITDNIRQSRIEFINNNDMKNVFFYYPFQDVYFDSISSYSSSNKEVITARGGLVARNVIFKDKFNNNITGAKPNETGNVHTLLPEPWSGDPKILGFGITDY